eukprot:jgi/Phyca11/72945/gw1.16.759.1
MLTLPPNATHLYQPLDVAPIWYCQKTAAIGFACSAYKTAIIERSTNAVSGFRCTGLYPPSIVNMTKRLKLYTDGGAKGNIGTEAWI